MKQVTIERFNSVAPALAEDVFLADGVRVIGAVTISAGCGIWYNAVLRGDVNFIRIGKFTNIQDGSVVHVDHINPAIVGDYVTVGHNALVHGCVVGDNCLIGMGAVLLSGSKIGDNCIIGAGAVVTQGKVIPPNSLVLGSPGRVTREVSEAEIADLKHSAQFYYELAGQYSSVK
ncbi:MAG: ferripyochelin binding protein (fbp) [Firmicutes bacterium]|nr:ferripyochelin binding protein (fbp) [Bacillota bacterium]